MTINSPAPMIFAMYLVVAEQQGADWKKLSGTIQNDILKEFIAQKEYIFPPRPSMRLITDVFGFCSKEVPKWNTISVSGYHIREAGSTAVQELAFTLRNGIEYVQWGVDAGLDVDDFVPRISFFFNAHSDFFEELAKYRAARKIWARVMRDRFHAQNERSWKLRFHTQTAGVSLTAQQPYNNVVRTALQALSAVLGGTNSLHTNSLDEALALPTAEAATLALRTQQIIAHESGVANVVDPLGGSYFLEKLTLDMEAGALRYFETIDRMGGMVEAVERGYPQREIAESSYRFQQAVEKKEKIIVGVNDFVEGGEESVPILYIDEKAADAPAGAAGRGAAAPRRPTGGKARWPILRRPPAGPATPCIRSSTACAPTRPWARCATPSDKFGGSMRKFRQFRYVDHAFGIRQALRTAQATGIPDFGPFRRARPPATSRRQAPSLHCDGSPIRLETTPTDGRRRKTRVVIAKPGLDGHDRGAKVIARALRDAGMEVIYTGLRQTPEQVVAAALQEDADVIGLSILSGAHMHICPRLMELVREKGLDHVTVLVGGIIPDVDIPKLREMGIAGVFLPGSPMQDIVDFINANVQPRAEAL